MFQIFNQSQIKSPQGVTEAKRSGEETTQKQAKTKKRRIINYVLASVASLIVISVGIFSIVSNNNKQSEDALAGKVTNSELSSSELKNIRSAFSSKLGYDIIAGDVNSWGGAFDWYFSTYGGKEGIASQAGVSSNLDSLDPTSMAKFLNAAKTYDGGKYKEVYDVTLDNIKDVSRLSGSEVDAANLFSYVGVTGSGKEQIYNKITLEDATKKLAAYDGVEVSAIEDMLNNRAGTTAGNIKLNSNGSIASGDVIFPDIMHLNGSSIDNFKRKIAFVNGNVSIAKFDLITVDKGDHYIVMLSVRDGESMINSDGSLYQTDRNDPTEPLVEPALVAKLNKMETSSLAISKECSYNGSGCFNVPAGATVYYIVKVKSNGMDASLLGVVDEVTSGVFDSLQVLRLDGVDSDSETKTSSTNPDKLLWWIGDLDDGKTATMIYKVTLKKGLADAKEVRNTATLWIGDTEKTSVSNNFKIKNEEPKAVLDIEKRCSDTGNDGDWDDDCGNFEPGDRVYFKIAVVSNDADAYNVIVEDNYTDIDHLFTSSFYSISPSATTHSGGTIRWNLGTIEEGSGKAITFRGTLKSNLNSSTNNTNNEDETETLTYKGYLVGSSISLGDKCNIATVTGSSVTSKQDDACFNVRDEEPTLRITKSCTYESNPCVNGVDVGGEVVYTLLVQNTSDVIANNLEVSDNYDESYIDITNRGTATDNGNELRWTNLGNLSGGQSFTLTYRATVENDVANNQRVYNVATVDSTNVNKDADDTDDYEFNVRYSDPELSIIKSCTFNGSDCATQEVNVGDVLTYTLSVTNSGQATYDNLVIEDDYDQKLTVSNISSGGSDNNGEIVWDWDSSDALDDIAGGQTRTVTYRATVDSGVAGQVVENTACIRGIESETNGCDDYIITLGGSPNLNINKVCYVVENSQRTSTLCEDANPGLQAGSQVEYVLTIDNTGTETATSVEILDDYPEVYLSNIINITDSGRVVSVVQSGQSTQAIRWDNLPDLVSNTSDTVSYRATIRDSVSGGTAITNLACVYDSIHQSTTADCDENTFETIGPAVEITKHCVRKGSNTDCASANLRPGDDIVYILTVNNPGDTDLQNIEQVFDEYDSTYLVNVTNASDNGVIDTTAATVTWTDLGSLGVGESLTLTFEASIASTAVNGTRVVNDVEVTADDLTDDATYTFIILIAQPPVITTGGEDIIFILIGASIIGGSAYYLYKTKKTGSSFGGRRSQEY